MKELKLVDILKNANDNPKGNKITSEIKEYVKENGNTIRTFKVLA